MKSAPASIQSFKSEIDRLSDMIDDLTKGIKNHGKFLQTQSKSPLTEKQAKEAQEELKKETSETKKSLERLQKAIKEALNLQFKIAKDDGKTSPKSSGKLKKAKDVLGATKEFQKRGEKARARAEKEAKAEAEKAEKEAKAEEARAKKQAAAEEARAKKQAKAEEERATRDTTRERDGGKDGKAAPPAKKPIDPIVVDMESKKSKKTKEEDTLTPILERMEALLTKLRDATQANEQTQLNKIDNIIKALNAKKKPVVSSAVDNDGLVSNLEFPTEPTIQDGSDDDDY